MHKIAHIIYTFMILNYIQAGDSPSGFGSEALCSVVPEAERRSNALTHTSQRYYDLVLDEKISTFHFETLLQAVKPTPEDLFHAFAAIDSYYKGRLTHKAILIKEAIEEREKLGYGIDFKKIHPLSWVDCWACAAETTRKMYQQSFTGGSVQLSKNAKLGDEILKSNGFFSPQLFLEKLSKSNVSFVFDHIEPEQIQRSASLWLSALLCEKTRALLKLCLINRAMTAEVALLGYLSKTAEEIATQLEAPYTRSEKSVLRALDVIPQLTRLNKSNPRLPQTLSSEAIAKTLLGSKQEASPKMVIEVFRRYGCENLEHETAEDLTWYINLCKLDEQEAKAKKAILKIWRACRDIKAYVSPSQWDSAVHLLKKVPQLSQLSEKDQNKLFRYKKNTTRPNCPITSESRKDYYERNYGEVSTESTAEERIKARRSFILTPASS